MVSPRKRGPRLKRDHHLKPGLVPGLSRFEASFAFELSSSVGTWSRGEQPTLRRPFRAGAVVITVQHLGDQAEVSCRAAAAHSCALRPQRGDRTERSRFGSAGPLLFSLALSVPNARTLDACARARISIS